MLHVFGLTGRLDENIRVDTYYVNFISILADVLNPFCKAPTCCGLPPFPCRSLLIRHISARFRRDSMS